MSFPDIHKEIPQRVHRKDDCNKPLPWQIAKRDDRKRKKLKAHKSIRGELGCHLSRWMLREGTNRLDVLDSLLKKESSMPPAYKAGAFLFEVIDSYSEQVIVCTWDSAEAFKWASALQARHGRFFYIEPMG